MQRHFYLANKDGSLHDVPQIGDRHNAERMLNAHKECHGAKFHYIGSLITLTDDEAATIDYALQKALLSVQMWHGGTDEDKKQGPLIEKLRAAFANWKE